MTDQDRGIYKKYNVTRLDDAAAKHKDCNYFVLDLKHDKHAAAALYGYAESLDMAQEYPQLMKEVRALADSLCRENS